MATRIGELLLEKGVITEDALIEAQRVQAQGDCERGIAPGERLGRIIMARGFAPPMEVVRALCEQRRIDDYILVGSYIVCPALVAEVPLEVANRWSLLPLARLDEESGETLLATDRAQGVEATEELERLLGIDVDWVEVSDPHFAHVVERAYALMAERGVFSVRIGEVLVRDGLLTADELDWALKIARKTNKRVGRVLVEEGLVTEGEFYQALARNKGLPLASAVEILSDQSAAAVASRLSRTFAIFNELVPFRLEDRVLSVACSNPDGDLATLRKLYECREVSLHLVTLSDMVSLLQGLYRLNDQEARAKGLSAPEESRNGRGAHRRRAGLRARRGRVVLRGHEGARRRYESLVANILHESIRRRASDIHIENYETFVVVRLRIDGMLYDMRTLRVDKTNVSGVVNVIKVMSDMNIAERRMPQGGRFRKRTAAGEIFDFRVQVQPTLFGENVTIRLLNQSASIVPLANLGLNRRCLEGTSAPSRTPPASSSSPARPAPERPRPSTPRSTCCRKDTSIKIVTIEDPIEYSLARIQQSQTHDQIGYTFAEATRAFLRQDPDVALVGEIRDEETARETIKLSQTGHIVFSTLHTNTAASAAGRMLGLGVDGEILAGELLVVVAQRLATRICPHCKVPYTPPRELLGELYPAGVPSGVVFYRGAGCEKCDGMGHKGRVALAEFWFVDQASRMLISRRATEDEIIHETIGKALHPLLADALEKVHAGAVDVSTLPTVVPMASVHATAQLIHERGILVQRREAAG